MGLLQRLKTPLTRNTAEVTMPPPPRPRPIGPLLRERREKLGLDLYDIGAELCIKVVYLAAIEESRPEALPGPAYAIGFLRAYAQYLGLDADKVINRFKGEAAELQTPPDLAPPMPLAARSMPGAPTLVVAVILAACGYGSWYYLSAGERSRPPRVAEVPAALQAPARAIASADLDAGGDAGAPAPAAPALAGGSAAAAPAPVPAAGGPKPAPVSAEPQPAASPPAAAAGKPGPTASEPIVIQALSDCWIQVRAADQSIVFSRVLKANEAYRVPAQAGLSLRTGNAGALAIMVGGKPVPSIGTIGTRRRDVALEPAALVGGTAVRG